MVMQQNSRKIARLTAVLSIAALSVVVAVPAGASDTVAPHVTASAEPTPSPSSEPDAAVPSPSPSVTPAAEPEQSEPAPEVAESQDAESSDTAMGAAAEPVSFTDVARSPEFEEEIRWMGAEAISTGYATSGGREYRPFGLVTRDAMAAFLYRYEGQPEFTAPGTPTFRDVTPQTSDFYKEIEWAASVGITGGYSDGTFKPTRPVTRDAMASFLYGLEDGTAPSRDNVYVDSSTSSEHTDAIEWLATQGVSQGWVNWQGRVYKPFDNVTRDAMAAFLYRLDNGAEPVAAAQPALEPEKDVWVTASTLNLRTQPTWDSSVAVTAARHVQARFVGARDGGWIRVRVGGIVGWAPSSYMTASKPSGSARYTSAVAVGELYFRNGPSNASDVVKTLSLGTKVTTTGVTKGAWSWTSHNGQGAWAPTQHMKRLEAQKYVWVTSTAELNLRSGPSWSNSVVVTGDRNAMGRFTGIRSGAWIQVQMGRMTAWAPSSYMTTVEPRVSMKRYEVNIDELLFRSGPSNANSVEYRGQRGKLALYTGISKNGWYWFQVNGERLWAPAQHLREASTYNRDAVMSVAYSQVGYRGGNYNNKYNEWIGNTNPYCMVFVAWVFDQAGYPQGVPKIDLYSAWARELQNSGVLNYDVRPSTLRRGDVALVDWVPRNGPTHTGIISRVEGDSVWLVEGNTTDGTGDPGRGVFERKRLIADIDSTYNPEDYARHIGR